MENWETIGKDYSGRTNSEQLRKILMKMLFLSWQILSNSFMYFSHFLVTKENDYYEIIAGERRWRAQVCFLPD